LINAIELIKPTCKLDKSTPVIRKTNHLNLDLPTLTNSLEAFVDNSIKTGLWSENAVNVTKGWIKEGLKQRCITRDLKWGIPVPVEGFKDKVRPPYYLVTFTRCYTCGLMHL
jgi:methionyl-tRNA synthetase